MTRYADGDREVDDFLIFLEVVAGVDGSEPILPLCSLEVEGYSSALSLKECSLLPDLLVLGEKLFTDLFLFFEATETKKEEKSPQQNPQFKQKKVAALSIKNASTLENIAEEQDVGSDAVSAAEVTICRQNLKSHLVVIATSDFIADVTVDGRVLPPDRVYYLNIQIEGDVERAFGAIFWYELSCDILLSERDWPPKQVRKLPHGEDVILPSFSDLVREAVKHAYAVNWSLAQTSALYRNHVGWDKDSPCHVIPIRSTPQPQPHYPVKHEAKVPVRKILTQLEYQGVIEPCISAMNNPLIPAAKPDHSYIILLDYRHLVIHVHMPYKIHIAQH
ncbi:hypothetical protein NDU88_002402 [Pleurodeles waltl]|uniref:Uncharacterized protein n=1 Tax=Pleurodeles waltl TaxID=8319 RepID=A0AAV7NLY1_PLEWA|nr:hypothetical protein NDU88_002402 [Pleurodeles waltl]